MSHLTIALLSFVVELVYAGYTIAVARAKVRTAMACSGGIALLKTGLTVSFVRDTDLIPALVVGQILGTFVALKLSLALDKGQVDWPSR